MVTTTPRTVFHEGELAVQRRAGVEAVAAKVGRYIHASLPPDHADFLSRQPFVVVAAQGADERVWASLIVGGAGFASALDDRRVHLGAAPAASDALGTVFKTPRRAGILAIEFDTRTRIRVNGVAKRASDGILVDVEEAFGNCPKFIQRRVPPEQLEIAPPLGGRSGTFLDAAQAEIVGRADTFFIASVHAQRGADASHRGGRPGFVRVAPGGSKLRFPDYSGNRMFQTLGNIALDPRVGLLFPDWETGSVLELTGRAHVVWDEAQIAAWPGAERLIDVAIDAVKQHERAIPARWKLIEPSPLNPPLSR
jgi:predicted pyridoxine 5'-phosphate oxidase superfamily flavin-nucleotide-binding protein